MKKKYKTLGIIVAILALVAITSLEQSGKVYINSSSAIDEDAFRRELMEQLKEETELLNVVKEDDGLSNSEFIMNEDNSQIILPYKNDTNNRPLGLLILEKNDGYWVESQDINFMGASFDEIQLKDLDGDGVSEVVIGYKVNKNATKGLSILKKERGSYREIFEDNYEQLFLDEFEAIGNYSLLVTKKNPKDESLTLNSLGLSSSGRIKENKVLIGDIDDKLDIKAGYLNPNKKGVVVEEKEEGNRGKIKVFTVVAGKIKNIPINGQENILNEKYIDIKDVNKDKVLDLPILSKSQSGTKSSSGKDVWMTYWYSMDDNFNLKYIRKEYTSLDNEFTFEIPVSWGEKINVRELRAEDTEKNTIIFDRYEESFEDENIITIGTYSKEEWLKRSIRDEGRSDIIFKSIERVYVLENSNGSSDTDIKAVKSNFDLYEK